MAQHTLLWIDMQVSRKEAEAFDLFKRHFSILRLTSISTVETEIAQSQPRVICFDFDFPTKPGLRMLQQIKSGHPRIPLLMLTVQHSEALAVWAFRSRVWDYLVKPVAHLELEHCLNGLREVLELQTSQKQERIKANVRSLIPEENRMGGNVNDPIALVPAIAYVEREFGNKVTSATAAQSCSMTPFQFSRLFKESYGFTFQEYVHRFRIREACRLLKNPAAEIAEIAFIVGFNDPSYFGKIFRRYMGCAPSEFLSATQGVMDTDLLARDLSHGREAPETRRQH